MFPHHIFLHCSPHENDFGCTVSVYTNLQYLFLGAVASNFSAVRLQSCFYFQNHQMFLFPESSNEALVFFPECEQSSFEFLTEFISCGSSHDFLSAVILWAWPHSSVMGPVTFISCGSSHMIFVLSHDFRPFTWFFVNSYSVSLATLISCGFSLMWFLFQLSGCVRTTFSYVVSTHMVSFR